jgi:hypothetical protein
MTDPQVGTPCVGVGRVKLFVAANTCILYGEFMTAIEAKSVAANIA